MKGALTLGAYQSRSVIAANQRCVNLYPETNPSDSEFPVTHLPAPGLKLISTAPVSGFRGMYPATNGMLFAVVATKLYRVMADWTFTEIGTIDSVSGPVSMRDNTLNLVIVDGTSAGYTVDLSTLAFSRIDDAAFYGSNRVAILDDFLLFNQPGTRQFYVSGALALTFDPLDIASKNGSPDKTVAVAVMNRVLWIFGERTTELWSNVGASDFTFARYPGSFVEYGCMSAASIASADTSIYWLGAGEIGEGLVFRTEQMGALLISTPALTEELRTYPRLDDAIGYTHQLDTHIFYVLTFPTADKTWVYDLSTKQWHERLWMDDLGELHRHRGACSARWQGKQVVGDWENGNLYELSADVFTDNGQEMLYLRSWPKLSNEGNYITYDRFLAEMQVGESAPNDPEPQVRLRWSDSNGRNWSNTLSRGLGKRGEFAKKPTFNRLGTDRGNGRIFELSWSANVKTALNGAYVLPEGES